jgi:hypothetical protein
VTRDFDDLVGTEGLEPEEELRLRRVHDLLVQAGPPPDLPPALERPPAETPDGEIVQFPLLPKRRWAVAALVAAALGAIAFGGGYLVGHHGGSSTAATRIVPMRGSGHAIASITIGKRDSVGNWPMELTVTGLPTQQPGAYYELFLSKDGKPRIPCGGFRVNSKTTKVHFTVPYRLTGHDEWVVAVWPKGSRKPTRVVLST